MFTAQSYLTDEHGWSVKLYHKKLDLVFWFDIWLDEKYNDVTGDWNQYIFFTDESEDRLRKSIQEDTNAFEEAIDKSIEYLLRNSVITQDEKGNWSKVQ